MINFSLFSDFILEMNQRKQQLDNKVLKVNWMI